MISAGMIGRDAEAYVGESLQALKAVVDEIVFVDTGSVDDTRAIAAAHGCRLFDFTWCDDFAAARNAAKEHASGEWILSVDCDEVVRGNPTLGDAPAYLVTQLNPAPNPVLRLFRNDPRIAWRNPVHECVSESVLDFWSGAFHASSLTVEHRGYAPHLVRGKRARNLAILERWAREARPRSVCSPSAMRCSISGGPARRSASSRACVAC